MRGAQVRYSETTSDGSRGLGLPVPPEWVEQALCAQADPEAFYPEKGGRNNQAKAVCSRCPVTSECLAYALEHNERFGIWGGVSERDRRRMQKGAA